MGPPLTGTGVKKGAVILIADRNPHVRDFLKREMAAVGYHVRVAESGRDALRIVFSDDPIALMIIDPDLPDVAAGYLVRRLRNRIPFLPIVVHAFPPDDGRLPPEWLPGYVEKRGSSIERIKELVAEMLTARLAKTDDGKTMRGA